MAVRNSTQYADINVNAPQIATARQEGGRVVPVTFTHTVVSGELGGASVGVSDEVRLCVLPANCRVVGFEMVHDGVGASAGAGATIEIGDSADVNRFYISGANPEGVDEDVAGGFGQLPFAGMNFEPTADTIVLLQWGIDNPVVGQVVKGVFWIIPGS